LNSQTAILIFTRTGKEEARAKHFHDTAGHSGNRAIAQRLIEQAVNTANQSGMPVFTCYSTEQRGHSFGERLANAMETVYARGFEHVIAIGNDCPSLTPELLVETRNRLERNESVLGPSTDGGVYLIGLSKNNYQRSGFIELPWESAQLQNAWTSYTEALTWLEQHGDIDHATDLQAFLHLFPFWDQLHRLLVSIIASFNQQLSFHITRAYLPIHTRTRHLRGPPR